LRITRTRFLRFITWPWRALRWALLTRPIRFTRFGLFYILFTLAVGGAAINTGNNLLYLMLGFLLGFIVVSGVLSDSGLWGLSTEWEAAGDFYVGRPAEFDVQVRKASFPAVIVWIEAQWNMLTSRHLLYWVPKNGSRRLRVSIHPERRGLLELRGLRYLSRFPFGLFEKFHDVPGGRNGPHPLPTRDSGTTDPSQEVGWVVFPRVEPLPLNRMQIPGMNFSQNPVPQRGPGTSPFDLRDFRAGDSSKRIHWKTTAKLQRLMVTEMERESDVGQTVHVSGWPIDSETPEKIERFISFLASLVFTLYTRGQPVGLVTPGAAFAPNPSRAHLKKLLTYLALVDPVQEPPAKGRLIERRRNWVDAVLLWRKYGGEGFSDHE